MSELESLGLDNEIIQEFVEETLLGLDALQSTLLRLEEEGLGGIDAVFRWVHTVKGTSGFLNLLDLQGFAHKYENFLQKLKSGKPEELTHERLGLVSEGVDLINDALQNLKTGAVSLTPAYPEFLARIASESEGDHTKNQEKVEALAARMETIAAHLRKAADNFAKKEIPTTITNAVEALEQELAQLQNFKVQVVVKKLTLASVKVKDQELLPEVQMVLTGLEEVIAEGSLAKSLQSSELEQATERIHQALHPDVNSPKFQWSVIGDLLELMPEVLPNFWSAFWLQGLEQHAKIEYAEFSAMLASQMAGEGVAAPTAAETSAKAKRKEEKEERKGEDTIRIASDYLDQFTRRTEALVMNRNYLENLEKEIERYLPQHVSKELQDGIGELEKSIGGLQKALFSIRSTRLSELFEKIPRMIRQLERDLNKSVRLTVEGEYIEVDRGVIAMLSDPLVHLVRNAIDHGLEVPEVRRQAGKDEQGQLRFEATKTDESLVLKVVDDGRGIDAERVLKKAIEKGLAFEDQEYSDAEVYAMLLQPGFSTAEQVTNVSGRGVGLDVVRAALAQQGGDVTIESEFGKGTTFSLTFPLRQGTLTRDVLLVQLGNQRYAVDHDRLREIIETRRVQLATQGQETFFCHRDELIPVLDLGQLLSHGRPSPSSQSTEGRLLIIEDESKNLAAVRVDQTLHQMQVVIKPFDHQFLKQNPLFAGTIVTGLGQPILVLSFKDVAQLL
jgi:two-component system chemotaxis sensor kinase CheA